MWFLPARKAQRTPTARSKRGTFRPRLEEALENRCLLSAGVLDANFGIAGLVLGTTVSNATSSVANAVVVQTDGKIVTGGSITVNGSTYFALERYNADGTPDTSFGTNGVVQTVVGAGASSIHGLALQSDGKIVAVGGAFYSVQPVTDAEWAVARYLPNGSLDTTFGGSGIVTTNVLTVGNWNHHANAVAIQGDGKIDVAGSYFVATDSAQFALERYNANGTLDQTFGSNNNPGIVITPSTGMATALAIQSDGKILLVGDGNGLSAARYTSTGQLDSKFGSKGIVGGVGPSGAMIFDANGVLVQSNGAIVVGGVSSYPNGTSFTSALTLARLTSTGHLDTSFGSLGFAFNNFMVNAFAIAQGANGDLLAAGFTQPPTHVPPNDFGVTAFLPGGTLDTTFGTTTPPNGTASADFSGGSGIARAMAIQVDGKIVAAGTSVPPGGQAEFALARFLPPNTKIGSFTASQHKRGSPVTLTASNIMNSNPTSYIAQVVFYYLDTSNNVVPLGTVTSQSTQTSYSLITSLPPGSYTLYAVATDSNGVLSDPLAISLQVL